MLSYKATTCFHYLRLTSNDKSFVIKLYFKIKAVANYLLHSFVVISHKGPATVVKLKEI